MSVSFLNQLAMQLGFLVKKSFQISLKETHIYIHFSIT